MKQRNNIKPMLFSTTMVSAILEGKKSQTRRVVKLPASIEFPEEIEFTRMQSGYPDGTRGVFGYMDEPNCFSVKSGYQIGDIIWVREAWNYNDDLSEPYLYRQQYEEDYLPEYHNMAKWKPSIHMAKEAARIFLKLTDVRVEELQNITEKDAIAEGVKEITGLGWKDYQKTGSLPFGCSLASDSFKTLWQFINGKESWERNPLVWVISFEVIDKPKDFQ